MLVPLHSAPEMRRRLSQAHCPIQWRNDCWLNPLWRLGQTHLKLRIQSGTHEPCAHQSFCDNLGSDAAPELWRQTRVGQQSFHPFSFCCRLLDRLGQDAGHCSLDATSPGKLGHPSQSPCYRQGALPSGHLTLIKPTLFPRQSPLASVCSSSTF